MSDKWWDMSDDELDDLFREASDKVEIPFDQSSLDKLKIKIDPKAKTVSRFDFEKALLLLLLLIFVGGGVGFYLKKNSDFVESSTQKNHSENTFVNPAKNNKTLHKGIEGIVSKEIITETKIPERMVTSQEKNTKQEYSLNEKRVTKNSLQKVRTEVEKRISKNYIDILANTNKTLRKAAKVEEKIQGISKPIEVLPNQLAISENYLVGRQTNELSELEKKTWKDINTHFTIVLPTVEESIKESIKEPVIRNSRFGVRLAIAPDVNAIERLNEFAFGKSAGILLEYNLTKRFVLQTGAIYTYKKYNTGIENYHAWAKNWATRPVLPTSVEGDCEILDIPLNLRYNVLLNPQNTWFVSAGVSSYLMLTEGYEYYYPETANVPTNLPRYVTWKRDDDYFSSMFNISFGFEKKLNQHISIQAEPYLKTPLKEIGRGKVNLYSSGVLFSLKYGF